MQRTRVVLIASALALACLTPAPLQAAARPVIKNSTVKVVGNDVTIKSSGGTTTVTKSSSCSPGITGYLYQSVTVLFGGVIYSTTQSQTCP